MARFRIIQLTEERGISVSELHRRIIEKAPPDRPTLRQITYGTVWRVANGKTANPTYDTLEGIAIALDVEVRDLYTVKSAPDTSEGAKSTMPHYVSA